MLWNATQIPILIIREVCREVTVGRNPTLLRRDFFNFVGFRDKARSFRGMMIKICIARHSIVRGFAIQIWTWLLKDRGETNILDPECKNCFDPECKNWLSRPSGITVGLETAKDTLSGHEFWFWGAQWCAAWRGMLRIRQFLIWEFGTLITLRQSRFCSENRSRACCWVSKPPGISYP